MKMVSIPSSLLSMPATGIEPPVLISAGFRPAALCEARKAAARCGESIGTVTPGPPWRSLSSQRQPGGVRAWSHLKKSFVTLA